MLRRRLIAGVALAVVCTICAEPVSAYIDPGASSLYLQGLIAAVAAGVGMIGLHWRRLLGLVRRDGTKTASSPVRREHEDA